MSVGESVHANVSSHAYVWEHKHQNEAISAERETQYRSSMGLQPHMGLLKGFSFSPPLTAQALPVSVKPA